MEVYCQLFLTPSTYRITPVAWLRLEFCPESRAVLSTSGKCECSLTDLQHMTGKLIKLEIWAQCSLESKREFWIFWIAGIKSRRQSCRGYSKMISYPLRSSTSFFAFKRLHASLPSLYARLDPYKYRNWLITTLLMKRRRVDCASL